jgi:hypothetical protein
VRIKTGMASCNRGHLRSSFLGEMRRTYLDHLERYQPPPPTASQGPNLGATPGVPGIAPNLATDTEITEVIAEPWVIVMTVGHAKRVQRFSLPCRFGAFSN